MDGAFFRSWLAVALALTCLGIAAPSAAAAGSYDFDQRLSLRGDCGTQNPDLIPDPSCPEETPGGRFKEPRSIAIDAYGSEYVASYNESGSGSEGKRIDVFDDEGHFISELADPFGPKSIAVDTDGYLYAFEYLSGGEGEIARYTPEVYEPEAGEIEYDPASRTVISTKGGNLGGIAIDFSNDHLYVTHAGDVIEEFGSRSEGNPLLNTIALPSPLPGAATGTYWSNWVAVDSQRRRLYASYCKDGFFDCGVLALSADPPYTFLKELDGSTIPTGQFASLKGSTSIAVDESTGHFFVADLEESPKAIYEFDENFAYFATTTFSKLEASNSSQIAVSNGKRDPSAEPCQYPTEPLPPPGDACNRHYLFAPFPKSAGAALAFSPPGVTAAEVDSVSVTNVTETEAELHATIRPNGAPTTYVFEYVTEEEFNAGGFANARIARTGTTPVEETVDVVASARGLTPGTSYRFRIVVGNEVPPKDELGGSFRTFADASVGGGCGNELLRTKFSALLPDCRAYELVTPADTNGRSPKGVGFGGDQFSTVEVSPSGNTVAFVTEGGSLPGTEGTGGFNGDLYRTSRGDTGWGNVIRMGPSGTETNNPSPGSTSPDQEHGLFWAGGEGTAVIDGATTHWVRYPDGRAELVGRGSEGTDPSAEAKLITEGGTHIIFVASTVAEQQEITLGATTEGGAFTLSFQGQTTDPIPFNASAEEVEDALAALPSIGAGNVSVSSGSAGGGSSPGGAYQVTFTGSLGGIDLPQLVADSGGLTAPTGEKEITIGTVRQGKGWLEPEAPHDGAAVYDRTRDPVSGDEETHVVSLLPGSLTPGEAPTYLDASADGTGIAFSVGDGVYLRVDNEVTYEVGENVTLADVSEGGDRVFYLEGGDLFAFDAATEGAIRFTDVGNATVVNIAPDGSRTYFLSTTAIADAGENPSQAVPVAGQQNLYLSEEGLIRFVGTVSADDVSGVNGGLGEWVAVQGKQTARDPSRVTPDGSVLLFESRANLAGYDPEGSRQVYRYDSTGNRLDCISCPPTGAAATDGASLETFALAQTTPPPFTASGFVPNLRSDGKRLFFQSHEALVARDSNDAQDVYEWEEAGVGSCTRSGGCVYLISSGHSARDNYLYGVSSSGDDVFFITEDILVGGDNDTPSIYDARVGGGFPEQVENVCVGEGCRLPVTPPPTLASPGAPAPGAHDNVKRSRHCPRGKRKVKRKGKVRCVKKHKHKKHTRKAGAKKGAGR